MKILYIGADDALAKKFLERMVKEDYEVFFLAKNNFQRKDRKGIHYKYYCLSENTENISRIMGAIRPEYIVYGGLEYMNENWKMKPNNFLVILNCILVNSINSNVKKIIFLSSFEIYGNQIGTIDEESKVSPISIRGIVEAEAEYLLQLYRNRNSLPISIIRASKLYSDECSKNKNDFLSNIYQSIRNSDSVTIEQNLILYPIHVGDFIDAIKRVIETEENRSYNIASSFGISIEKIVELVSKCLNKIVETNILLEKETVQYNISKASSQLDWIDINKLEDLLAKHQILFVKDEIVEKKESNRKLSVEFRKTIENAIIFLVFFACYFYSKDHTLFSQINWMLLYVSVISLIMGIRQSALAVGLASLASLFVLDLNLFEMTNFYSYAEVLLMITQYVFFGISISYSSDMIKEKLVESERKQKMAEEELHELKEINLQNLKIKNEYEKRILDSKMSITQLYSIVNKIMVLNPERVLMEIVQVISEVIETNTVAIYMQNGENPHLRLLNSLNEESIVDGKSWNISYDTQIQEALNKAVIYYGNVWNGEPAVVVPITHQEKGTVVLVIKTLGYEQQSLYYMNLLRTLLIMIKDAVDKAMAYENLVKAELYIEETDILVAKEFRNLIQIAKEKQGKQNAEYSIIEIKTDGDLKKAYFNADRFFRTTDYFGTDDNDRLFVLLGNTEKQESEFVLQRLEKNGIIAWNCSVFDERA